MNLSLTGLSPLKNRKKFNVGKDTEMASRLRFINPKGLTDQLEIEGSKIVVAYHSVREYVAIYESCGERVVCVPHDEVPDFTYKLLASPIAHTELIQLELDVDIMSMDCDETLSDRLNHLEQLAMSKTESVTINAYGESVGVCNRIMAQGSLFLSVDYITKIAEHALHLYNKHSSNTKAG